MDVCYIFSHSEPNTIHTLWQDETISPNRLFLISTALYRRLLQGLDIATQFMEEIPNKDYNQLTAVKTEDSAVN